jgi:spore maturation protein CgeB
MVAFLEAHPENDIVGCPMEHTGETHGIHFIKPKDFEAEKEGNHIDSGQVLYRTCILEKIGMFDERILACEDWDYILRAYALNGKTGTAFGWLEGDPLCSYHWHQGKRMFSDEIKPITKQFEQIIRAKEIKNDLKIMFVTSGDRGRTASQVQLADNVLEALKSLCFVEITDNSPDLIIFMGPIYNFTQQEIIDITRQNPQTQTVGLFCEDPQALHANINYIDVLDWIVTNDINAYYYYIDKVNEEKERRVLHWNCLSISNKLLEFVQNYEPKKIYDVCFIGYPYPSRIEFLTVLIPMLDNVNILLIGDTWTDEVIGQTFKLKKKNVHVTVYCTLNDIETAKLAMQSKIILIKHRDEKDLGGFPIIEPASVNRGYIETAYRCVLLMDNNREYDTFLFNYVVKYANVKDCAIKIEAILSDYSLHKPGIDKMFTMALTTFTHRARLMKILNCIRSQRFNKKID